MKNLVIRTISGLCFLAIMVGAILYNSTTFWAISSIIVAVGIYEFFNMTLPKVSSLQQGISMLIGVFCVTFCTMPDLFLILFIAIICLFILIIIIELYQKSEKPFENIALLIFPVIYIAIPFAFMNIAYHDFGKNGFAVLAFFIFIWASDVGAYCFGMLLGKHKLFPRISPKKSWEGFFGGIITAIIAGILVSKFMFAGNYMHHWLIISVISAIFGTVGDLAESMLKRSAGVKDSGKIMPGHGGILDRFDAALLAFPLVFVYMYSFLLNI